MKLKYCFSMVFLLLAIIADGQLYKVSGVIMDEKKDPLPLASVQIKEVQKGLISKDDGSYEFSLERGKYDLVVSMIGFKPKVITFFVNDADVIENVIMEMDESANLSEVIVKAKTRDRADEIIRNVIQNKEAIQSAAGSYSCNIYIKASRQDSVISKKKDDTEVPDPGKDYKGMSLAEISMRYDKSSGGQIKEERLGVKKSGNTESLFYLSTTDGDFNIYNNLLKTRSLSSIPFVSPLSYSGLVAYRFKTIKIDRTSSPKIYTIAVKPRQLSNATIEGELTIMDSSWVVLKAEFRLPPAHMPEYDFFEVEQEYSRVHDSVWMMTRQQFNYYSKMKGGKRHGETTVLYSAFDLGKTFRKGYFGNEVSSTSSEAYEKDSVFWNKVRMEPLSKQQALYVKYQDSIYRYMHSEAYLDSMDRVLNKVTWKKMLIFGQLFNDHKKERSWIVPPVTSLIQPISYGGPRLRVSGGYRKTFPSRKNLSVDADVSYGFRNHDINGTVSVQRMYNPFSRGQFRIKAGRNFDFIYPGDVWINVLKRSNIYLNNSLEFSHEIELMNGVHLSNTFEVALRRSVSDYKVGKNSDTLFGIPNDPPVQFDPYNATYNEIKLYLTPGLKYIREPKERILLGSKWPTFYVIWKKGIPALLRSKIDFDYLEFGMIQHINLGVAGNTSYIIKTGDFLNRRDLRIIDYKFQRQGDPIFFKDPYKAFQALDSTFAVFHRYYQGNLVHEFNGSLINKIPFLKRLKLQEIAGAGVLIAPEKNLRYVEFFTGLERVFTWPFNPLAKVKLGVYVVGSAANKFNNPVQFRIGFTTWDRLGNRWR
jgi:hypothetical protein